MNKILFVLALLVAAHCPAQIMPSAHRNDYTNTDNELEHKQQQLEQKKMLLDNSKKYQAPDLLEITRNKIKAAPNSMNIYNPLTEDINVIILYLQTNKKYNYTIQSDNSIRLPVNDTCSAIFICGDKSNYKVSDLRKGKNYEIRPSGNCLGLVVSSRFTK